MFLLVKQDFYQQPVIAGKGVVNRNPTETESAI